MVPFYGWGSSASRVEPLQGGSLLFTSKFPEISGTSEGWKAELTLEPPINMKSYKNIVCIDLVNVT